jgi:hypothetical protein
MLPKHHAMAAGVAAVPLKCAGWSWRAVAGFLSAAVLIDVDHYLYYVWKKHDLSLRRAFAYHRRKYYRPRRWVFRPHWPTLGFTPGRGFHAIPVLVLALVAALRWRVLVPLVAGLVFHRVQDELWSWFE